jgi:putative pyruvate formate lyase activating enzyme
MHTTPSRPARPGAPAFEPAYLALHRDGRLARRAVVSSAFPHTGEEDCLRGHRGSGTVFFAGCSLRCAFCQNADISWLALGEERDAADLAATMLSLQERGCHNVNLVTPTHVVAQVIEAVDLAAGRGLRLPLVYNSSGYDRVETLALRCASAATASRGEGSWCATS